MQSAASMVGKPCQDHHSVGPHASQKLIRINVHSIPASDWATRCKLNLMCFYCRVWRFSPELPTLQHQDPSLYSLRDFNFVTITISQATSQSYLGIHTFGYPFSRSVVIEERPDFTSKPVDHDGIQLQRIGFALRRYLLSFLPLLSWPSSRTPFY